MLILVVCIALIVFNELFVYTDEQNKKSHEFHNEFIKNFRRNGLNTTVADDDGRMQTLFRSSYIRRINVRCTKNMVVGNDDKVTRFIIIRWR